MVITWILLWILCGAIAALWVLIDSDIFEYGYITWKNIGWGAFITMFGLISLLYMILGSIMYWMMNTIPWEQPAIRWKRK